MNIIMQVVSDDLRRLLAGTTNGARPRLRAAFTLMELLVTMAILAILMGLLIPALQSTREAANRAHCANNLHHQGIAYAAFLDSNGGKTSAYPGDNQWMDRLKPFLEEDVQVFICTSDPRGPLSDSNTNKPKNIHKVGIYFEEDATYFPILPLPTASATAFPAFNIDQPPGSYLISDPVIMDPLDQWGPYTANTTPGGSLVDIIFRNGREKGRDCAISVMPQEDGSIKLCTTCARNQRGAEDKKVDYHFDLIDGEGNILAESWVPRRWTPFFGPKRGLYLLGDTSLGPARLGGEAGRAPQLTLFASSL